MITAREMRELEQACVRRGTSVLDLMERAGRAVANAIAARVPTGSVLVIAYHGNNGGDGMAAARYLMHTHDVHVWFLGYERKLTAEAQAQHERLPREVFVENPDLKRYDVLVDALLGTGARAGLPDRLREVARQWNAAHSLRVAVDLPTGMSADDPRKPDVYFEPDLIVTFHDLKPCLRTLVDRTTVADIGLGVSG